MSKITRYSGNVVPFANNAQAGERFVFGSSTEQSNDLTTLVSANYLRGWGVVGPSDFPPLEWFNAQAFTSTQFIAYLHQMGIAEWNGEQEYHQNSAVNRNGVLYYCKTNDHVSVTPPESDPTNWRKKRATDVSYDNTASGLAATDVQGAIDEVDGRVDDVETYITELSTANNARTKEALNATGDAPIYAARAWVNIKTTGLVEILNSGNIIGITDNGVGNTSLTFAQSMQTAMYATTMSVSTGGQYFCNTNTLLITGFSINTFNSSSVFVDLNSISVSVFE